MVNAPAPHGTKSSHFPKGKPGFKRLMAVLVSGVAHWAEKQRLGLMWFELMDVFTWSKIRFKKPQPFVFLRKASDSLMQLVYLGWTPYSSKPSHQTFNFMHLMSIYLWSRNCVLASQSSFSALCFSWAVTGSLLKKVENMQEKWVWRFCYAACKYYFSFLLVSSCHITLPNFPMKGRGSF